MKQFLLGVLVFILIGVGALVYRSAKERPVIVNPMPSASGQACPADAKVCPDGSSVGRTGADCAFAACQPPNVENVDLGIAYVIPSGFVIDTNALIADPSLHAAYELTSSSSTPDTITLSDFPIPAGKTANQVILSNTTHESSGIPAKAMNELLPVITNGKTYQSITVERFEGTVHTEYYLARTNDVLRFDVTDYGVTNWSSTNLDITQLPAHAALLKLLSTLQVSKQ